MTQNTGIPIFSKITHSLRLAGTRRGCPLSCFSTAWQKASLLSAPAPVPPISLLVKTFPARIGPPLPGGLPSLPGPQHQVETLRAPMAFQTETQLLALELDPGLAGTSPEAAAPASLTLPLCTRHCPENAFPGLPRYQPGAGRGVSPPDIPGLGQAEDRCPIGAMEQRLHPRRCHGPARSSVLYEV